MEVCSTQSVRQEQQERPLFLLVVVVGYNITFIAASKGDVQYTVQQLILEIGFGILYLIIGFLWI